VPLDITWTVEVQIPQLAVFQVALLTLGDRLVAEMQQLRDEITRLVDAQADGADAIAAEITTIANEMSQWTPDTVTQETINAFAAQIRQAATTAEDQAAQIRANSAQIASIVPDAPPQP